MEQIKVEGYAKINLSIDVLGKREDGYHELRMIMQQVDLKDTITISNNKEGIIIECNVPNVPTDSSNLVYKACEILSKKFNINKGVHIYIEKKIPMAAGLAGGSADAAATLKGLNRLWNLKLTLQELMDIGVSIGADVPYCLMGGTALAEGIGEKLTPLDDFSNKLILLAKPDIEVSTAFVYKNLDLDKIKRRPDIDELIISMKRGDLHFLADNMVNVLETVTVKEYPIIQKIKDEMIKYGGVGSLMSGSGPTVFGIFDNEEDIKRCESQLKKWINTTHIVKTV